MTTTATVYLVDIEDRGHELTLEIEAPSREEACREARALHPAGRVLRAEASAERRPCEHVELARILAWTPRSYGSPLGVLTEVVDGRTVIVARDIRRAAAAELYAEAAIGYDRDGMSRRDVDGRSLAERLAEVEEAEEEREPELEPAEVRVAGLTAREHREAAAVARRVSELLLAGAGEELEELEELPRATWYDAPEPHRRCLALVLERGRLFQCHRSTPADLWPAAELVADAVTLAGAEAVARTFGLVREEADSGR